MNIKQEAMNGDNLTGNFSKIAPKITHPKITRPKITWPKITWRPERLFVLAFFIFLAILPGVYGQAARGSMAGAYASVAVFVYATLLLFYLLESRYNINILEKVSGRPNMQLAASALLGMMPGCGGAILVTTGFASGQLSFGAFVATLTSTMGDAAFLLIAEDPIAAAIILPISAVIGFITGWIVDRVYRPKQEIRPASICDIIPRIGKLRFRDKLIFALFLPGLILGISGLAQIELPVMTEHFSTIALLITIAIWALSPIGRITHKEDAPLTRANEETAFVMVWVVTAFLLFDMAQVIFGFDLGAIFAGFYIWTPFIATLIGFLPGCGPQILVTTLYLSGAIPLGALMANAISNDGDALFPALAISPRAASIATLITAIPALIFGYVFLFIMG